MTLTLSHVLPWASRILRFPRNLVGGFEPPPQHFKPEMFFSMETFSESPRDSAIAVLFDLFCIIRTTGVRVAEYADTIQIQGMVQAWGRPGGL